MFLQRILLWNGEEAQPIPDEIHHHYRVRQAVAASGISGEALAAVAPWYGGGWHQSQQRVTWNRIRHWLESCNGDILVVAPAEIIIAVTSEAIGLTGDPFTALRMDKGRVTILQYSRGLCYLEMWNTDMTIVKE